MPVSRQDRKVALERRDLGQRTPVIGSLGTIPEFPRCQAIAGYKTRGYTASIAAGSALTEWIQGKSRADLAKLKPEIIEEAVAA